MVVSDLPCLAPSLTHLPIGLLEETSPKKTAEKYTWIPPKNVVNSTNTLMPFCILFIFVLLSSCFSPSVSSVFFPPWIEDSPQDPGGEDGEEADDEKPGLGIHPEEMVMTWGWA